MTALISPTSSDARRGNTVDPHILFAFEAVLLFWRWQTVEGVLEIDLDAYKTVLSLNYRGHLREELDSHRLATDEFTFGRSALGLGYDEEVKGLEEVALAVPVVAMNEHHPRPQIDLQPLVVSYVSRDDLGEMYVRGLLEPGRLVGRFLCNVDSRE